MENINKSKENPEFSKSEDELHPLREYETLDEKAWKDAELMISKFERMDSFEDENQTEVRKRKVMYLKSAFVMYADIISRYYPLSK